MVQVTRKDQKEANENIIRRARKEEKTQKMRLGVR